MKLYSENKSYYLIIGNSKIANHFCNYFELLNLGFERWSRNENTLEELENYINCNKITHVLVLIPDGYIDNFIENYLLDTDKMIVHFSGSLQSKHAFGVHPLCTFSDKLYNLEDYKKISFIIDSSGPDFNKILPGLPNKYYTIASEHKPLYHALCVISGNFTSIIWSKIIEDFQNKLNIPKAAVLPYLEQTTENIKYNHQKCLTGPLARKDYTTINNNLSALQEDKFLDIYKAFVNYYEHT